MFKLYTVASSSMEPTLFTGDVVLARRRPPKVGDVVVFASNERVYVKRVSSISAAGVELLGDNRANSLDSRCWGLVPQTAIIGVVTRIVTSVGVPKAQEAEFSTAISKRDRQALLQLPLFVRWLRFFKKVKGGN